MEFYKKLWFENLIKVILKHGRLNNFIFFLRVFAFVKKLKKIGQNVLYWT